MSRVRVVVVVLAIAIAGGVVYYRNRPAGSDVAGREAAQERGGGGFGRGGGFGGFGRPPMTVELATASRADLSDEITIVGNLVGEATVEAVPKVAGRLQQVNVRLGDRVSRGQILAKIEDSEIREQVKQAEASFNVAQATVRQREADLKFAQTNFERSRSLFASQLLPQSAMDDADARQQAANAQLDLARAQFEQAKARLEELRINLANTVIASPVNGFVGKRNLDQGAYVTPNSSFISLVDIRVVKLLVNVIESDLRRISPETAAMVQVDAYPGETFAGRVARIAPVLDPATRTASMEVEIPNPSFRLKPGMYARVSFVVEQHRQALVVPTNAVVDIDGKRGVFVVAEGDTAKFQPVLTGLEDSDRTEITEGLQEGDQIIATGAAGLREGDRIMLGGAGRGAGGPERGGQRGDPANGGAGRGRRGNSQSQ